MMQQDFLKSCNEQPSNDQDVIHNVWPTCTDGRSHYLSKKSPYFKLISRVWVVFRLGNYTSQFDPRFVDFAPESKKILDKLSLSGLVCLILSVPLCVHFKENSLLRKIYTLYN